MTSKASRQLSASEIAKNPTTFDEWALKQRLVSATVDDIPIELWKIVENVFNVAGSLPLSLVDKSSPRHIAFKEVLPEVAEFLCKAHEEQPSLFSRYAVESPSLVQDLAQVHASWARHLKMQHSSVKWTEADRAQVYSGIRNPGVRSSQLRNQCRISLARALEKPFDEPAEAKQATVAIPDAVVFVTSNATQTLWRPAESAFNILRSKSAGVQFAANATPAAQMPERSKFEFVSCVWEDKKPDQKDHEPAYRQNRMSTAAIVRHLHSFKVKTVVIGLIWAEGKVRAHVDWPVRSEGKLSVMSARYAPLSSQAADRRTSNVSATSEFHIWDLDRPSSALAVYLLVGRIDDWTNEGFRNRVVKGVKSFADKVKEGKAQYMAWKAGKIGLSPASPPRQPKHSPRKAVPDKPKPQVPDEDKDAEDEVEDSAPSPLRRSSRQMRTVTRSSNLGENASKHVELKKRTNATKPPTARSSSGRMVLRVRK